MSQLGLTAEHFGKRLNMEFFTNINKALSESEFQKSYPSDKFDVFEKGIVENWIKDTYESTGGEIIKGGFNDLPEVHQVLSNMKEQVSLLKGVLVEDIQGNSKEVFVLEKSKQENDESIEKAKDSEIEKGAISDTLYYGDKSLIFSKTGSDIKSQLGKVKEKETLNLADLKTKMNSILEKLPFAPTEKNSDCDIQSFKWELTYSKDNSNSVSFNDMEQGTVTSEQSELCRQYNDMVWSYRECKKELDSINLLEQNLDDKKSYELSARQMLAFGF